MPPFRSECNAPLFPRIGAVEREKKKNSSNASDVSQRQWTYTTEVGRLVGACNGRNDAKSEVVHGACTQKLFATESPCAFHLKALARTRKGLEVELGYLMYYHEMVQEAGCRFRSFFRAWETVTRVAKKNKATMLFLHPSGDKDGPHLLVQSNRCSNATLHNRILNYL